MSLTSSSASSTAMEGSHVAIFPTNDADSLIYTAEKTKKDLAEKFGKEQIERIDKAVAELREALKGKDVEKIRAKSEETAKILQEVSIIVYQQAATQ